MNSIEAFDVMKILNVKNTHPFSYDLGIEVIASKKEKAGVTICCHGYGSSNHMVEIVDSFNMISDHLVGFNFPDYDLMNRDYDPKKSSFGTINELLPLLYIIKRCVIDGGLSSINLYGFSAGGGAVINALVALHHTTYDEQLLKIGITPNDKKRMIEAIEHGLIILDCPLKSIEEISELRGQTEEFMLLADRYRDNNMRPIDSVQQLKGLNLTIMLHFQNPDEVIGNREDERFIERLREANSGVTDVVIGSDGGHNSYHNSLWQHYKSFMQGT